MDKIQQLYELYKSKGLITEKTSVDAFRNASQDQIKKLYGLGKSKGLFKTTDETAFSSAWSKPKKAEAVSTESPLDSAQQSSTSVTSEEKETEPSSESSQTSQYPEVETTDREEILAPDPDLEVAALYEQYKEAGKITLPQQKEISQQLDAQERGDRPWYEEVNAFATGMINTGMAIPIYKYTTEEQLAYERAQKNKVDFLNALPQDKITELNAYAVNRTVELDRQNVNILAENEILGEKGKLLVKDLLEMKNSIETAHKEGKTVLQEGYDMYEDAYEELKGIERAYNANVDLVEASLEDIGDFTEELNLLKKNYEGLENFKENVRLSSADMIGGLMDYGVTIGEMAQYQPNALANPAQIYQAKQFTKEFRTQVAEQRELLRPMLSVSNIETKDDLGRWFAEQFATQIPVLTVLATTGGTTGLSILGASSGGQKIGQMRDTNEKGKTNYNNFEMFMAGTGYGLAEAGGEYFTRGILSKGSRAIASARKGGSINQVKNGFTRYLAQPFMSGGTESLAEFGTQISQNLVDISLGEDRHVFDNVEDAIASGGALGFSLRIMPTAIADGLRYVTPRNTQERMIRNSTTLQELATALEQSDVKLSEESKKIIRDEMDKVSKDSEDAMNGVIEQAEALSPEQTKELIKLEKENNNIIKEVGSLEEANLPDNVKEQLREQYKERSRQIAEQKAKIIGSTFSVTREETVQALKEEGVENPTEQEILRKQEEQVKEKSGTKQKKSTKKDVPTTEEEGTNEGAKGADKVQGESSQEQRSVADDNVVQSDSVGTQGTNDGGTNTRTAKEFSWDNLNQQPETVIKNKLEDVNSDLKGAFPEEVSRLESQKNALEKQLEKIESEKGGATSDSQSDIRRIVGGKYLDRTGGRAINKQGSKWVITQETTGEVQGEANTLKEAKQMAHNMNLDEGIFNQEKSPDLVDEPVDKVSDIEKKRNELEEELVDATDERAEEIEAELERLNNLEDVKKAKDIENIDLSDTLGINKAMSALDKLDDKLTKFGKENLSAGIPVAVAQAAVKAMKLAVQTSKVGADVLSAGLNSIKNSDWYKGLTASQREDVEKNFMDYISNPKKEIVEPNSFEKIGSEVEEMLEEGKTEKEIIDNYETKAEKKQAKNQIERLKDYESMDAVELAEESLSNHDKSIDKLYEKPKFSHNLKRAYIRMMQLFFDRQYEAKSEFKKNYGKTVRNYMITAKGSPGYANFLYEEYGKEIWGDLSLKGKKPISQKDLDILQTIIGLRRTIAIDKRKESLGQPAHIHPDFGNRAKAERSLEGWKQKLGEDKFNDLNERADNFFKAYREILMSFHESGLISKSTLDTFFEIDYNPRLYLKFLNDSDDLTTSMLDQGAKSTEGRRDEKRVIKALENGSEEAVIMDIKYLLSRSLNVATKVNAMNTLANRVDRYLDDVGKKLKDLKKKDNPTKKDKKDIKNLENLFKKIQKGKVVGVYKSGKNKGKPKYAKPPKGMIAVTFMKEGVDSRMYMSESFYAHYTDSAQFIFRGAESNRVREAVTRVTGSGLMKNFATGVNPSFFITNTPRDFLFALTFSDSYNPFLLIGGAQLVKDIAVAVKDIEAKNEKFEKFVSNGGMQDFLHTQGRFKDIGDVTFVKRYLEKKNIIGNRTEAGSNLLFNVLTFNRLQMLSEMGIRMAIFNRQMKNFYKSEGVKDEQGYRGKLEKEGLSQKDINWKVKDSYVNAVAASRSTTDFSQGGLVTKDFESLIPYINASTQGTRAAVLAIEERPKETILRMTQAVGFLSTMPIAFMIYMLSGDDEDGEKNWTPEFKKMNVAERIKYFREGLSVHDMTNYVNLPTGKFERKADGTYQMSYKRIAKPQFMTPLTNYADDVMLNKVYQEGGLDKTERGETLGKVYRALYNNVSPVQADVLTRNPMFKAYLTYQTGYDFYREKDLSYLKGDVEVMTEGHENNQVEQFYKDFGKEYGISPVRFKGALESIITGKSTSPYVGGAYAAIENRYLEESNKKGIGDIFLKSFSNRINKTTSEWNRKVKLSDEYSKEKAEVEIRLIEEKKMFSSLAYESLDDKKPIEEVIKKAEKEFERLYKEDPYEYKRMLNTFMDILKNPKKDATVSQLKFEDANTRAIFLEGLFGDSLGAPESELSDEDKKLRRELVKEKILNEETLYKYYKRINKLKD